MRFKGVDQDRNFFQFIDCVIKGKTIRIFNLHLPLGVSPSKRISLLKEVLKNQHPGINLVCGDFNSFGHFPWSWLLGIVNGSGWKDYISNELKVLETVMTEHNLRLSLRKTITYPNYRTQLDHIMIPRHWSHASRAVVIEEQYGSDHRLVLVEASLHI